LRLARGTRRLARCAKNRRAPPDELSGRAPARRALRPPAPFLAGWTGCVRPVVAAALLGAWSPASARPAPVKRQPPPACSARPRRPSSSRPSARSSSRSRRTAARPTSRCACTATEGPEAHVRPLPQGGKNDPRTNGRALCRRHPRLVEQRCGQPRLDSRRTETADRLAAWTQLPRQPSSRP